MAAAAAAVTGAKEVVNTANARFQSLLETFQTYTGRHKVDQYVRKAIEGGDLSLVLRVIQTSKSHLTFRSSGALSHTLRGLRRYPQSAQWKQSAVSDALRQSVIIASMLDNEKYGFGKASVKEDPRQRSEVIAPFLELAAVHAYKYRDGNDVDGKVKAHANRLLSRIEASPYFTKEKSWTLQGGGPVESVLDTVPTWHGLSLARAILQDDMPRKDLAGKVIDTYGAGLENVIEQLKATNPKEMTYNAEALAVYEDCIRPLHS